MRVNKKLTERVKVFRKIYDLIVRNPTIHVNWCSNVQQSMFYKSFLFFSIFEINTVWFDILLSSCNDSLTFLTVALLLSGSLLCLFYLLCSISSFLWWVSAQYYKYYGLHFATLFNTVEAFGLIFHNHFPICCAGRHKLLLSCCTDCGGRQGEFSRPAEFELSDWIRDCCVRCVPQRSEWCSQRQPDHAWVILKTCNNQHWLQNISKHVLQACVLHNFTVKQYIVFLNTLYCAILSALSYIQFIS